MLLFQEEIRKYNKSKILVIVVLMILWKLQSSGNYIKKELLENFTENPVGNFFEIVSIIFEIFGFFVLMIVLGELIRKLYRLMVKKTSNLQSEGQDKIEDQEALNISIILSAILLMCSIA